MRGRLVTFATARQIDHIQDGNVACASLPGGVRGATEGGISDRVGALRLRAFASQHRLRYPAQPLLNVCRRHCCGAFGTVIAQPAVQRIDTAGLGEVDDVFVTVGLRCARGGQTTEQACQEFSAEVLHVIRRTEHAGPHAPLR